MFISRSSLWSNLNCVDADKTRVYLERSGTSPINLRLRWGLSVSSLDTFLQIIPQAIGQLKSLSVASEPGDLHLIIPHLSHPAPLLERLDLDGRYSKPQDYPALASTIFNGDLSPNSTLWTYWSSGNTSCTWNSALGLIRTRLEVIVATWKTEERRVLLVVLWWVDLRL